ncbi:MAG: transcription-repair coupling factor [Lachnospiraceae bacterium]|nr:transcription-repair coupling factor [Lachnospiraceae bacterium]
MSVFTEPLKDYSIIEDIKTTIKKKKTPIRVTGCAGAQKCNLISAVSEEYPVKLVIAENEIKAKEIAFDLSLYDKNVYLYPEKDILFYSADVRGNTIQCERLAILKRIINGESITVVAGIAAAMDRLPKKERMQSGIIHIDLNYQSEPETLAKKLVEIGYIREGIAELPGQFAVRGGIVDIFPVQEEVPVRIEFWGDAIDSIRSYDPSSQRSIENIKETDVYPAQEIVVSSEEIDYGLKNIEKDAKKLEKKFHDASDDKAAANLRKTINELKENLEFIRGSVGLESYVNYFLGDTVSFLEYFDPGKTLYFLDEPQKTVESLRALELEFGESMKGRLENGYILPGQTDAVFDSGYILSELSGKNLLLLSTMDYRFSVVPALTTYELSVSGTASYNGNFEMLISDLLKWKKRKYRVILLAASRSRGIRLAEDLRDNDITAVYSDDLERSCNEGEVIVMSGSVSRGFEYPLIRFAIICETDIFGQEKRKRKRTPFKGNGNRIESFAELKEGDYVVHESYGVGIYRGIEKVELNNISKDYIKVEYKGGGTLYVLASAMGQLQKYSGADTGKPPKLNRLDSGEWKKTRDRVGKAVKDIAEELIKLYALRQAGTGYRFSRDTVWQNEFEEMFPYDETEDQIKAIEDTKRDMESSHIMDRLICGDVGFGKTEIAIRAAFKAVQDGKQVAVLVPTTILAQQHYNTFTQRMAQYPISIGMLSRFKTASEQKKVVEKMKNGLMDIVIGTHRLLSKDISFKNLGLLVVDEEQRFGVTHKEKIKQMKGNVDVLTLTATPIPRTLHMSLAGIRDMSVLDEAPVDRLPIQTFVLEYNEEVVREAINRELARGGQVYYVHNRIAGIEDTAAALRNLLPDANIVSAHGKMNEKELEDIMFSFVNGEIDVLVSTTIIETGLDISNVNTIIIDNADRFGLSQLYQLRGRVGRSNRTAYAFMMYRQDRQLRETAEKRLEAIKEFTELGSGIKIAMRDLEIRGAGNLLGAEQSGHMEAVGYELYCKMLNQAIKNLKPGEIEIEYYQTSIDLEMDAFIPSSYIKNELQKLDMYKRIAAIETPSLLMDLEEELTDRYGDPPAPVINLLYIAITKAEGHEAFVTSITQKGIVIELKMYEKAGLDVAQLPDLIKKYNGALRMHPGKVPKFDYILQSKRGKKMTAFKPEDIIDQLRALFADMKAIRINKSGQTNEREEEHDEK